LMILLSVQVHTSTAGGDSQKTPEPATILGLLAIGGLGLGSSKRKQQA